MVSPRQFLRCLPIPYKSMFKDFIMVGYFVLKCLNKRFFSRMSSLRCGFLSIYKSIWLNLRPLNCKRPKTFGSYSL